MKSINLLIQRHTTLKGVVGLKGKENLRGRWFHILDTMGMNEQQNWDAPDLFCCTKNGCIKDDFVRWFSESCQNLKGEFLRAKAIEAVTFFLESLGSGGIS